MTSAPESFNDGRPLGVAMIGHAFMGRAHSLAWRNVASFFDVPAYAMRVLVGSDASSTAEDAARLGWAESSTDWYAAVTRDDIDIVDICAPGAMHAEIATAALKAGKHVLVEKPLANTLAEAQSMADDAGRATAHNQAAMIGFNYRRMPSLALARSMVANGRIGRPTQMRVAYFQDWLSDPDSPMSWRLRKEQAGSGALGDLGSHAVDQIRFLLGAEIESVTARMHTFTPQRPGPDGFEDVTVDDAVWATLLAESGAVVSFEASRVATGRKNSLSIEIYGDGGSLTFDLERPNELWFDDAATAPGERGRRRILATEPEHPYMDAWWPTGHVLGWDHTFVHEIRDFLVAAGSGKVATPSFADGLAVQQVLDAMEQSAADGSRSTSIGTRGATRCDQRDEAPVSTRVGS